MEGGHTPKERQAYETKPGRRARDQQARDKKQMAAWRHGTRIHTRRLRRAFGRMEVNMARFIVGWLEENKVRAVRRICGGDGVEADERGHGAEEQSRADTESDEPRNVQDRTHESRPRMVSAEL